MNPLKNTIGIHRRTWQLAALLLFCTGLKLPAQELTVLGGVLPKTDA